MRGQEIAISVAKALIQQGDNEILEVLKFGKDWVQSLFRRMGFRKCAATTEKVIYLRVVHNLLVRYYHKN